VRTHAQGQQIALSTLSTSYDACTRHRIRPWILECHLKYPEFSRHTVCTACTAGPMDETECKRKRHTSRMPKLSCTDHASGCIFADVYATFR